MRAWFDLEPVLAGRDVDFVDGHWKLRREVMRERIGKLAYEGINGFRFLAYGGWTATGMQNAEDCFAPYMVVGGKFDLDQPNPDYWPIMVEVANICKEFNCEFVFCLFDNCQFWHDPKWACWGNNVQGRGSYFEDIPRSEAFTLQAVNHLGGMKHVSFCIINEGKEIGSLDLAKTWYTAIFKVLKAGGIAPERVDVGALLNEGEWDGSKWQRKLVLQDHVKGCSKGVYGEQAGKKVWLPVHNVPGTPSKQFPFGPIYQESMDYFPHLSCRLSNDGCKDKDSTAHRILFGDMCYATINNYPDHKIIFEFLSDSNDLAVKLESARFMVGNLGIKNLPNYHRKEYVPETEPQPEPEPEPEPEPTPQLKENWHGWWCNNWKLLVAATVIVLALLLWVLP